MSLRNYKVDDVVYEPYNPKNYGRVLKVEERHDNPFNGMFADANGDPLPPVYDKDPHIYCLIRWKDGTESWHWELHLKSLNELIATTERKLKTHKTTLERAMEL